MTGLRTIIVATQPPCLYVSGALYVSMTARFVWRDGRRAPASTTARRVLVALVARPGAIISRNEIVDLVWGDLPSGGPDHADKLVQIAVGQLRFICPVIRLVLTVHGTRGWSVRPYVEASP